MFLLIIFKFMLNNINKVLVITIYENAKTKKLNFLKSTQTTYNKQI